MHMKTGVQVKATLYILQIKAMCKPSNQAFDVRVQTSDIKSVGHGTISISCLAAEQNSSVYNRKTGKGMNARGLIVVAFLTLSELLVRLLLLLILEFNLLEFNSDPGCAEAQVQLCGEQKETCSCAILGHTNLCFH